ncbi:MAG: hypothetical protein EOO85_19835, partial [Pedobacter sp.]
MRLVCYVLFLILSLVIPSFCALSQSIPVGTNSFEDYYRRSQLLGRVDSNISFTVRPLSLKSFSNSDAYYPDVTEPRFNLLGTNGKFSSADGKITGGYLPLRIQTQFNSDHPYGWNDGIMIPAKGLQTFFSAGFFANYGPLAIQLNPEMVVAANSSFETFDKDHYDVIVARYYDFYNKIDQPARFGDTEYSKVYWGQSSIRINYKALSFGLSTENLWWGPGMRNSLLMSNNAPGFKHLTLNTTKPILTPIGSFEGQLVAGRLDGSGYGPLEPNRSYFGSELYLPKPDAWRYLSGLVITWQPKWVPGLFLGISRSSQTYSKDLSGIQDYFPVFSTIKKVKADDPLNKRDERTSMFFRWLWKEEMAEIYFELGHNNYSGDFHDALLEPNLSRAYIFGLRKLLPLSQNSANIMINFEVTQLAETSPAKIATASGWYTSQNIPHGYTNKGEVLGITRFGVSKMKVFFIYMLFVSFLFCFCFV